MRVLPIPRPCLEGSSSAMVWIDFFLYLHSATAPSFYLALVRDLPLVPPKRLPACLFEHSSLTNLMKLLFGSTHSRFRVLLLAPLDLRHALFCSRRCLTSNVGQSTQPIPPPPNDFFLKPSFHKAPAALIFLIHVEPRRSF